MCRRGARLQLNQISSALRPEISIALPVWISKSGLELTILDFECGQTNVIGTNWRHFASCFLLRGNISA
jgi:hypothetical protein